MIRLIEPCEAYLPSYTEAFDEYEGYHRRAGNTLSDKVDNVIDGQAMITRRYWKSL